MLRIRRPDVGWMQNVSLDIILPAAYIPGDMALLPIWITSGSCFALIHPGTNDSILLTYLGNSVDDASAVDVSRISIPGLFHLVLAEAGEPIESFLISGENAIATSYESSVGERCALPGLTLFPLFFPCTKSAMIYCCFWMETVLFGWQVTDDSLKSLYKYVKKKLRCQ